MEPSSSASSSSLVAKDFRFAIVIFVLVIVVATVVVVEDEEDDGSVGRSDLGIFPSSLSNFFLCRRYIAMVARASVTYCSNMGEDQLTRTRDRGKRTYARMLPALNRHIQLLLYKISQSNTFTFRDFRFIRQHLGISCEWVWMGEEEDFQVVVDCMAYEDSIFQEFCHFFLNFGKRFG